MRIVKGWNLRFVLRLESKTCAVNVLIKLGNSQLVCIIVG